MSQIDAPPGASTTSVPHKRPGLWFIAALTLAVTSTHAALMSNAILTLSLKASEISDERATTVLSVVVGVGSLFALLGYPVIGRLSDSTTSRWGRRRPYLFAGIVLLGAGAYLSVSAASTAVLTCGYVLTTLGAVCALVACSAVVPDQFAAEHRGLPSAVLGLGLPLGALLGLFLAQLVQPNLAAMFFVPAAVAMLCLLVLAFSLRDTRLEKSLRPAFSAREFMGTFWVNPLRHPAFGWAWWSRMLIFFGVASVNSYQAFYLIMVHGIDPAVVGSSIFAASILSTGLSLLFAPLLAKWSDLVGRRKPFVIGSAVVFAIGLAVIATANSYPMFLLAVAIMGIGQGVYFAVDMALVIDVLPDPKTHAKDLGIMNLAMSLPSSVVPAVAPALLAIGASAANPQNFAALFLAGTIAAVLGALCIVPIRSVK
ncbi:MFS transporter [Glutamicibacter sp. MNS18]|uniref:MFS transporter n=1 Tax=Glutamicibacter sp. MNS18 TaxID=2989817 RepID=UPI0022359C88|nr:MFS transporter [Glutamicibacter sp. MNS18]MCW4465428.1 MFS transporter [Glutamicibacter sp. MNS18]